MQRANKRRKGRKKEKATKRKMEREKENVKEKRKKGERSVQNGANETKTER